MWKISWNGKMICCPLQPTIDELTQSQCYSWKVLEMRKFRANADSISNCSEKTNSYRWNGVHATMTIIMSASEYLIEINSIRLDVESPLLPILHSCLFVEWNSLHRERVNPTIFSIGLLLSQSAHSFAFDYRFTSKSSCACSSVHFAHANRTEALLSQFESIVLVSCVQLK